MFKIEHEVRAGCPLRVLSVIEDWWSDDSILWVHKFGQPSGVSGLLIRVPVTQSLWLALLFAPDLQSRSTGVSYVPFSALVHLPLRRVLC